MTTGMSPVSLPQTVSKFRATRLSWQQEPGQNLFACSREIMCRWIPREATIPL